MTLLLSLFPTVASSNEVGGAIRGLVAPVLTPFTPAGDVDISRVSALAAHLNQTGVMWAFTAGTTGESTDLTVSERKLLAEEWLSVSKAFGLRVIVHVGCDSINDARELATHAEKNGAAAIAAMPPTYFKPANAGALAMTLAVMCAFCGHNA